jgi:hypothetical protein
VNIVAYTKKYRPRIRLKDPYHLSVKGANIRTSRTAGGGYNEHLTPEQVQYLKKAAEIFCMYARTFGAGVARHIPIATGVEASLEGVYVITDGDKAPMARPFEAGLDHPLFGNRSYWYKMKKKPYMEEAAKAGLNEAAEVYSHVIDSKLRRDGFA